MEDKLDMYSFSAQEVGAEKETDIKMLPIVELHDFEGHPFKVEHDMKLSLDNGKKIYALD